MDALRQQNSSHLPVAGDVQVKGDIHPQRAQHQPNFDCQPLCVVSENCRWPGSAQPPHGTQDMESSSCSQFTTRYPHPRRSSGPPLSEKNKQLLPFDCCIYHYLMINWLCFLKQWNINIWQRSIYSAWMSNYIYVKQQDGITHRCPKFKYGLVKPRVKLGRGWVIKSHIR